ncbi:hypothetical protein BH24ACT3_BH24ACT3_11560 [soil metagenome]
MLRIVVAVHVAFLTRISRISRIPGMSRLGNDRGQTTAEYALVLLGAAAVALLVLAWAGKTDRITKLLNTVVDELMTRIT